jgi:hypothetical protein
VILGEYEVLIEAEDYRDIHFEFNVLDDQTFLFHLEEKKQSVQRTTPIMHNFFKRLLAII